MQEVSITLTPANERLKKRPWGGRYVANFRVSSHRDAIFRTPVRLKAGEGEPAATTTPTTTTTS